MARLELRRVTKRFGAVLALNDVSLTVEEGEFFVVVGPNGSGKTTLLRVIAGLVEPDAGDVVIGGVSQPLSTCPDWAYAWSFRATPSSRICGSTTTGAWRT